jgi:secreted Zn-dependent insulinase-like peptidase
MHGLQRSEAVGDEPNIPQNDFVADMAVTYTLAAPPPSNIFYTLDTGQRVLFELRSYSSTKLSKPLNEQLQKLEQLGFEVLSAPFETATEIGFRITIQGDERIDVFLARVVPVITESDFETHKSAIEKTLNKSENLDEESTRLWSHIKGGRWDFERGTTFFSNLSNSANIFKENHDAAEIKSLGKNNLVEFCREFILPSSIRRKKLVVLTHSDALLKREDGIQPWAEANGTTPINITDIKKFKESMELSERPQPVKDAREYV